MAVRKTPLKGTLYPPKNSETAVALRHMIETLRNGKLNDDAQILENLRNARSNYLNALHKKSLGRGHRIGSYTKSLRNAKKDALTLYHEMMKCPSANIFLNPETIKLYLQSECSCIT